MTAGIYTRYLGGRSRGVQARRFDTLAALSEKPSGTFSFRIWLAENADCAVLFAAGPASVEPSPAVFENWTAHGLGRCNKGLPRRSACNGAAFRESTPKFRLEFRKKIEPMIQTQHDFMESLILAQGERWRRV